MYKQVTILISVELILGWLGKSKVVPVLN